MTYHPPFTITTKIIDLISAVSEQVGFVQRDFLDASPQLRKANRIKTITGTLQIEGSTLTEEKVSAVLDGKPVLASARELAEVQGAIAAYDRLNELNPLKLDDLLEAHRLMMGGVLNQAGSFRDKQVGVYKGKEVVHVAPPAHQISGLMAELFDWIQQSDAHPLIVSSVFHYEFEFIHPFMDGNGRMGRLWQTLMLAQWKPLFADMPLESVIKTHQQDYYQVLGNADTAADSTVFITFMLKSILQTLENAPLSDQVSGYVSDQVESMLAVMPTGWVSSTELMALLKLSHKPTFRKNYVLPALEQGYIEMFHPDSPRSPKQKYRKVM